MTAEWTSEEAREEGDDRRGGNDGRQATLPLTPEVGMGVPREKFEQFILHRIAKVRR